jgi:hypothetical protein
LLVTLWVNSLLLVALVADSLDCLNRLASLAVVNLDFGELGAAVADFSAFPDEAGAGVGGHDWDSHERRVPLDFAGPRWSGRR